MQVRGVDQRYLQPWRQECVWLRTVCLFSRREILSDWSPIHKICLKFALYVFVVFVHMVYVTISYTVISTVRDWHTRVGLVVTVSGLYAADLCVPCTWFRGSLC